MGIMGFIELLGEFIVNYQIEIFDKKNLIT